MLHNLAVAYKAQNKYADAKATYQRVIAIRQTAFGESHPELARSLYNMAQLEAAADNIESALGYAHNATAAVITHSTTGAAGVQEKSDTASLLAHRADFFLLHLAYLDGAVQKGTESLPSAAREAFDIAQWANQEWPARLGVQYRPDRSACDGAGSTWCDGQIYWFGKSNKN